MFGAPRGGEAVRQGLVGLAVRLNGLVKADEFARLLRERVDLLFAPMSFAPEDADDMKLSFPSKLTDYTACGLPILIYSPEYSSAVQRAKANQGVAYVATDNSDPALRAAVRALQFDPALRLELAKKAFELGAPAFSAEAAGRTFMDALSRPLVGKN